MHGVVELMEILVMPTLDVNRSHDPSKMSDSNPS
jgi:hypothetical protein